MSTKSSITSGKTFHLYHELTLGSVKPTDAFLKLDDAKDACVEKDYWSERLGVRIQLPCEMLDDIAIAWIKYRKLQGAVGGPVGLEWGSPDCPYE